MNSLVRFLDGFIADGKTLEGRGASDSTKRKWKTARNHLARHFPKGQKLEDVTPTDAQAFRQYLELMRIKTTGEPMRENAKRKLISSTKVMFNVSVHRDHCLAVRLEQIGVLLDDAVFGRLCR
ncbi:MAG TPA: hypothetical protein EYG03_18685, partial [Planctomycetes bacterium]|nr:hypothetical protein [Planctomycetota bacterium]